MGLNELIKKLFKHPEQFIEPKKQEQPMQFISITEPDEHFQQMGYDPYEYVQVNYGNGTRYSHTIISRHPLLPEKFI